MFSVNAIVKIHDYKIANDWSFEKEITIFVLKVELKDVLGDGDTNCLHWNTDYFDFFFRNRILLTVSISRFWDKTLTGDFGNKLKPNKTDKFG